MKLAAACFALVLALFAYACFSLSLPNGEIRCSDDPARLCPAGYSCVDMFCWQNASAFGDGGATD